jgi:carboxylesterase type B
MQYNPPRSNENPVTALFDEFMGASNLTQSEDCLYLNVFAPIGGSREKPVLFWIYGGSGTSGAISQYIYDGSGFAAYQDIVVVAANYRVNGETMPDLDTSTLR